MTSCSFKNLFAKKDQSESIASEDEFDGFETAEDDEFDAEDVEQEVEDQDTGEEEVAAQDPVEEAPQAQAEEFAQEESSPSPASDGMAEYTAQGSETLMWIAFKVYGDYLRWKDIRDANPGMNYHNITAGTTLKYPAPSRPFHWNPRGNPYLVLKGDTLGLISNKVYGRPHHWRSIWDNNRPMIKNPNLIFAGFTVHWLPEEEIAAN